MNTCFCTRVARDTDGLAWTFAGARIGLRALAAHRQSTKMPNSPVTLDALKPLEVHSVFPAEITLNNVLAVLDGVYDLGQLLLRQIFGSDTAINVGSGEDFLGIAGADSVNVAQRYVNALFRWYFYSDDAGHISIIKGLVFSGSSKSTLPLFVPEVGADNTDHAFAPHNFAVFAKFFYRCTNFHISLNIYLFHQNSTFRQVKW